MFGEGSDEGDWKNHLNDDAKETLSMILDKAKKHQGAYMQADDVKIAQVWAAIVEMKQEVDEMKVLLEKLAAPFKAIVEAGEAAKRKAVEDMVRQMIKPSPEQEAATQKLVDSLMQF
jgi:hypothetical protein